jgi:transcriptional/translational regulatory protein YebC/TACO1
MEIVADAGAEDLARSDDRYEVTCPVDAFHPVQQALENKEIPIEEATLVMEPSNTVELDGKKAEQCLKLLEVLEDHDDVQNVFANLEVDDDTVGSAAS